MDYLKIHKYNLEAKKLRPLDFLECEEGVIFSIFSVTKAMGIYGQMKQEEEADKDNLKILFEVILPLSIKDFKIEDYHFEQLVEITQTIIANSLSIFGCMRPISRKFALFIDQTARRYNKTPIEIICPTSKYNDLDAYLFNIFIENIAVDIEKKQKLKRS